MIFSETSNVTLVITSCNRFDLLKMTLDSFSKHNTYPLKELIIIEDSGSEGVKEIIPELWLKNSKIIINKKKLGQIKSIDLAYQLAKTDYIFHCEDDWLFYKDSFIEESLTILESDSSIINVWLRDFENDVKKHYPFHSIMNEKKINDVVYYQLISHDSGWRGFTFNPTLKRLSDYKKLKKYERPYMLSGETESFLSNFYEAIGMNAVILRNGAVKHIGWDKHVFSVAEKKQEKRYKQKKYKHLIIGGILGTCFGLSCSFLL